RIRWGTGMDLRRSPTGRELCCPWTGQRLAIGRTGGDDRVSRAQKQLPATALGEGGAPMPDLPAGAEEALGEYRAYLETLSAIQIDPRLRGQFSLSDLIQETLLEAYRDLAKIEALPEPDRRRWLRRMLLNNLLDEVRRHCHSRHDVSLEVALEQSSCRLADWLGAGGTPPRPRPGGGQPPDRPPRGPGRLPRGRRGA